MKYIIILLIPVLFILGFNNKELLLKYNNSNLATVLDYNNSDDYVEPKRDIGNADVSIESSTTSEKMSNSNTKIRSAYSNLRSMWTHHVNQKARTNADQFYPYGTNITYYFTDWSDMNKYGFFLGWVNEYTGSILSGSDKWSQYRFTLFRNTEVISKYQNCAKPFPDHVYFNNINDLERKMVKFSQNISDQNLRIKAKGEVAALAIQYENGDICAKFIEQCTLGGVSCSADQMNNFFNAYDGKKVKQIFHYHTHDYNSAKDSKDKRYKDYRIEQENKKMVYIPSLTDLFELSMKINAKIDSRQFSIKGIDNNDAIEKVISPNGYGYIYDVPASNKNINIYMDDKVDEAASLTAFNEGLNASMNQNNRKKPINQDTLNGYNYMLKHYQDKYSARFTPFTVK